MKGQTMFTKYDKAIVAGLIPAIALLANYIWHIEIPTEVQGAIITIVDIFAVFLVPNKPTA